MPVGEPRQLCGGVLTAAVGVQSDRLGQLPTHTDRHRHRGLDELGPQVLTDGTQSCS